MGITLSDGRSRSKRRSRGSTFKTGKAAQSRAKKSSSNRAGTTTTKIVQTVQPLARGETVTRQTAPIPRPTRQPTRDRLVASNIVRERFGFGGYNRSEVLLANARTQVANRNAARSSPFFVDRGLQKVREAATAARAAPSLRSDPVGRLRTAGSSTVKAVGGIGQYGVGLVRDPFIRAEMNRSPGTRPNRQAIAAGIEAGVVAGGIAMARPVARPVTSRFISSRGPMAARWKPQPKPTSPLMNPVNRLNRVRSSGIRESTPFAVIDKRPRVSQPKKAAPAPKVRDDFLGWNRRGSAQITIQRPRFRRPSRRRSAPPSDPFQFNQPRPPRIRGAPIARSVQRSRLFGGFGTRSPFLRQPQLPSGRLTSPRTGRVSNPFAPTRSRIAPISATTAIPRQSTTPRQSAAIRPFQALSGIPLIPVSGVTQRPPRTRVPGGPSLPNWGLGSGGTIFGGRGKTYGFAPSFVTPFRSSKKPRKTKVVTGFEIRGI